MIRSSDILPDEVSLTYPLQSSILLDGAIDPEKYIVGPGDLLGVYLWGEIEMNYQIRVTPEGFMIIPTVGSLLVSDRSITEVRDILEREINQNYAGLEVTVYLNEPRRFRLYVSGLVYMPGMHESHALERVSDLIVRAGLILPESTYNRRIEIEESRTPTGMGEEEQPKYTTGLEDREVYDIPLPQSSGSIGRPQANLLRRTQELESIETLNPEDLFTLGEGKGSSTRSIIVHRKDSTFTADLLRFVKLGDLEANPYITSGDHIEVPSYNGNLSVFGEVNDPGTYEYKTGDTVRDLIGFGGGLTPVADTSYAKIVRFDSDGRNFHEIEINLYDALYNNPDSPEYVLEEADRLNVRKKYEYKTLYNVTVYGEVMYPGQYPILKNGTKLSEIIRMAGGVTENENLREAKLIRINDFATRDIEYERLLEIDVSERTHVETDYIRNYQRSFDGSINVDFVKLIRENDPVYDVTLNDGDIIYIPLERNMVHIIGAVLNPGYIQVKEGADIDYYIEKAGGYNWNVSRGNIRIVKANSHQRYKPGKKVPIEGGDTIHVMEKQWRDFWENFRQYAGLLTQVATLYLIANQVKK